MYVNNRGFKGISPGTIIQGILRGSLRDSNYFFSSHLYELSFVFLGDVNGDGQYDNVDDIQVDCGCSAGTDAEEYYTCQEYVSTYVFRGWAMPCSRCYNDINNRLGTMIFPFEQVIFRNN